ncbi:uncharacterized protein LOC110022553 [Phalaenopsis equestris]|uniref:uncharacterized protein LOC110022553 n=1 Tax=Phalaenopsis equestris TaxID=78828 RepID=UPI0009E3007B|nr:uncharacterized protein LOC110022553 [Phalaenopsis equestris]
MDSMFHVSDFIYIEHNRIFEDLNGRDLTGHPFLVLHFFYNIDGERVDGITNEGWRRFAELEDNLSIRNFIQRNEPLPMDIMVDPEDLERERDMIVDAVASLMQEYGGVDGMKALKVDVSVEVNRLGEEGVFMDMDYLWNLRERRMKMCLMEEKKKVLGDEECAICLNEMMGVEDGPVRTPCSHRFHVSCIGRGV